MNVETWPHRAACNAGAGTPGITRPDAERRSGRRAFTLLEILMVIALIALFAAVVGGAVVRVLNADHPTPEDVFWQACRSAQKMAALSDHEVSMTFDPRQKKLVWSNGQKTEEAAFDPASGNVSVQFLQAQKGGSLMLIAGQVVETQEVPRVTFYPDGTCTAFRVQFRAGANAWQVAIDPWTCAPMLESKRETAR